MATRTVRVDDLSGEILYGGAPVRFEVEGTEYEIDLSPANEKHLREALAPYIQAATRAQHARYRRITLPRTEPNGSRRRR